MSAANAKQHAGAAVRRARPWLEPAIRCGYVAKGIIYGAIGLLAFLAAIGSGGKAANQRGAIDTMATLPLGKVLLVGIAVALAAYSTWKLYYAFSNPENEKPLKRVAAFLAALVYYGLTFAAFQASRGMQTQGQTPQQYSGVFAHPIGRYLVIAAGIVIFAVGIAEFIKALKDKFMEVLKTQEMNQKEIDLAKFSGRLGLLSRAVVFALIAWFFIRAGIDRQASEAGGISKALITLGNEPFGRWLLGFTAIGLISYAIFMFVQARFRRITLDTPSA